MNRLAVADLLRATHLAALLATGAWMGAAHGGLLPALVLALIAASGEALPRGAWRELGSPALVICGGLTAWLVGDGSRGAMHATLGTLVAALVLVPARPGALRLLAPLCVLELVVAGLPDVAGTRPWIAIAVLVPLALLALAADAWLGARLGARPVPGARLAALRWAVIPALAAAALGTAAFSPAERLADALRSPSGGRGNGPGPGQERVLPGARPGDAIGIAAGDQPPRDPTAAARLFLPRNPEELVYLRLAACSRLQRDVGSGRWRWLPASGEIELDPQPPPAGMRIAQLVRMPGWGDTVFIPDDGGWAGLDGLYADGDGNRWRPGLRDAMRSYQVALGGPARLDPDPAAAAAACTEIPPGMQDWPWAQVERAEWRDLPPTVAAARIGEALRARCSYDLDVPMPPEGTDPLAHFLFAGDPRQRRGICEHFAGAATLLLRRAGHPARCVAGFASGEWDGSGIVFRRLHAHAWVEILDEQGVWLRTADPTPPIAHAPRDSGPVEPPPDPGRAVPVGATARPAAPPRWPWWCCGLLALAIAVALRSRRRTRPGRQPDRQAVHRRRGDELVRLAQEFGLRVVPSDTAAALCARLTARTGVDLGPQLARYEAARFGHGPDPGPWPAEALRAARPAETRAP